MLEVSQLHSGYGPIKVLYGVSLAVGAGEILCVMGRNGAGKTTVLKTIMGLVPISSGTISLEGERLNKLPAHEIPKRGVGYIPQGRRLFPQLTVDENIQIGLAAGKKNGTVRKRIFSLFPALKERLHQQADTLSGGEQQMLATARALALSPKILLLDEPTEGLQPSMIEHIRHLVMKMRDDGFAIILVEQRIDAALSLADRVTIIENGKSVANLSAAEFGQSPDLVKRHLGV